MVFCLHARVSTDEELGKRNTTHKVKDFSEAISLLCGQKSKLKAIIRVANEYLERPSSTPQGCILSTSRRIFHTVQSETPRNHQCSSPITCPEALENSIQAEKTQDQGYRGLDLGRAQDAGGEFHGEIEQALGKV
jgi:hypothetical protein